MDSDLGEIYQVGQDVLSSQLDPTTGTVTITVGDSTDAETISPGAEIWAPFGFASRPAKPTPGQPSAQAAILKTSGVDVCFAGRDVRCQSVYGLLDYGETAVFATEGQARSLWKKDGSINHYTRVGNSPTGAGMVSQIDAANDTIRELNGLGFGFIVSPSGVTLTAGKSGLVLGADGSIKLIGTLQVQIDGATVVLGSLVEPVVSAALKGPTGIAGSPSLKVLIQ